MADIDIGAIANNPQEAQNENGRMKMFDLDDIIKADIHNTNKKVTKPFKAMRTALVVPPGTR